MIYGDFWLYCLRLQTDGKFYVGHSYCWPERHKQHETKQGSALWVQKHGFRSVYKVFKVKASSRTAQSYENDMYMYYARIKGAHNVRGGDVVCACDIIPDYLLPKEFGGKREVDWGLPMF